MDILDAYIKTAPSDQNVLDLFDNEWSSFVPGEGRVARPGTSLLFDDGRVTWLGEVLGGFSGLRVLELGPLEVGHSTMLEQWCRQCAGGRGQYPCLFEMPVYQRAIPVA